MKLDSHLHLLRRLPKISREGSFPKAPMFTAIQKKVVGKHHIWVGFHKWDVPPNGGFIMENPMKVDDWA